MASNAVGLSIGLPVDVAVGVVEIINYNLRENLKMLATPGSPAGSVSEAVVSRLSVRDFLPDPVPEAVLKRVLQTACRAPSGGNLQPWHVYVLTGAALQSVIERACASPTFSMSNTEYKVYPDPISEIYFDRRFKVGEDMYSLLGIAREDRAARRKWFINNFRFFNAPVGLFCFVDRIMDRPQFADLGMFLQSIMLLLREEGYDSCAQEFWAMIPKIIYEALEIPENLMLFCGMAIGKRDPAAPVNNLVSDRASLEEFAVFRGF